MRELLGFSFSSLRLSGSREITEHLAFPFRLWNTSLLLCWRITNSGFSLYTQCCSVSAIVFSPQEALFKNLLIQFGKADQKENVQLVFTTMWMNKSFPVTPISPLSVAETHSDLEKSRSSDLKNKKNLFCFCLNDTNLLSFLSSCRFLRYFSLKLHPVWFYNHEENHHHALQLKTGCAVMVT